MTSPLKRLYDEMSSEDKIKWHINCGCGESPPQQCTLIGTELLCELDDDVRFKHVVQQLTAYALFRWKK